MMILQRMISSSFLFIAVVVAVVVDAATYPPATLLGTITTVDPAFLLLSPSLENSETTALFISAFGVDPLRTYGVYVVPDISSVLSNLSEVVPQLSVESPWPNVVTPVPSSVFKDQKAIVVPSGFLVPTKSTGEINILVSPTNSPATTEIQISEPDKDFFYHNVTWRDINGDGRLDILTSRATKPLFSKAYGELLWYEQPEDPTQQYWPVHSLLQGPDFFFQLYDIDNDGIEEMIAAEFFAERLVLYYTSSGSWLNATDIQSVVIDDTIGALFDVSLADVNNDGKIDLLATNHVDNSSLSGLYAYEIPENFKTATWKRHTLASGFKTVGKGPGAAALGDSVAFFPDSSSVNVKPLIALAGDGAQEAYILSPSSQSSSDWSYELQVIYTGDSTVGQVIVQDVNGDGFAELFVPLYDSKAIQVFSFSS